MSLFGKIFGDGNVDKLPNVATAACDEHGLVHIVKIYGFNEKLDGNYCSACVINNLVSGLEKVKVNEN